MSNLEEKPEEKSEEKLEENSQFQQDIYQSFSEIIAESSDLPMDEKIEEAKHLVSEVFPDRANIINQYTTVEDIKTIFDKWMEEQVKYGSSGVNVEEILNICQTKMLYHLFDKEYLPSRQTDMSAKRFDILSQYSKQFELIKTYSTLYDQVLKFKDRGRTYYAPIDKIHEVYKFTAPILEINNNGDIVESYKRIKKGDLIYIWQTLSRSGVEHLAVQIVTKKGRNYSFGFGHEGTAGPLENAPGVFYTPDFGLNYKFQSQKEENERMRKTNSTATKRKYVNLISITEINDEHLTNLNNALGQVESLSSIGSEFTILNEDIGSSFTTYPQVSRSHAFSELYVNPKKTTTLSPSLKLSEININFNYSWEYPEEYCMISGTSTHRTNCASFIKSIFGDVLECGFYSNLITDPSKCRHNTKYKIKSCLS